MKHIHIIGGGTVFHVRPHLALSAPAYGGVARYLFDVMRDHNPTLWLSKMAGGSAFETNEDLEKLVQNICEATEPSIVFMSAAVCDFEGVVHGRTGSKDQPRLSSSEGLDLHLSPAPKIIGNIRGKYAPRPRKDIFVVGFKTTTGKSDEEMFLAALKQMKDSSSNLVFVNDIHRRMNMIVTPEQAVYAAGEDRLSALRILARMALQRSQGHFTRSKVLPGSSVPWSSPIVNSALRAVVDHCAANGAYKDLLRRNATVGHFAQNLDGTTFLTSRRGTNLGKIAEVGLVRVCAVDDEHVEAYGSKPSVGGQSQRMIFRDHPDVDSIVHFHCPPRPGVELPTAEQAPYECGSHECGQNTSQGLREVEPGIKAVYLKNHGPNIVFNSAIDPQRVISFIDRNFDLSRHTGQIA